MNSAYALGASRPGIPITAISLFLARAATAAASLLQVPHHGAQNHRRISLPVSDPGSKIAPSSVGRSSTANATGTSIPTFLARVGPSSGTTPCCRATDTDTSRGVVDSVTSPRTTDVRSLEHAPSPVIARDNTAPTRTALTSQRLRGRPGDKGRFDRCEYPWFNHRRPCDGTRDSPCVRCSGPHCAIDRYWTPGN